jgi:hypothetical protein
LLLLELLLDFLRANDDFSGFCDELQRHFEDVFSVSLKILALSEFIENFSENLIAFKLDI